MDQHSDLFWRILHHCRIVGWGVAVLLPLPATSPLLTGCSSWWSPLLTCSCSNARPSSSVFRQFVPLPHVVNVTAKCSILTFALLCHVPPLPRASVSPRSVPSGSRSPGFLLDPIAYSEKFLGTFNHSNLWLCVNSVKTQEVLYRPHRRTGLKNYDIIRVTVTVLRGQPRIIPI